MREKILGSSINQIEPGDNSGRGLLKSKDDYSMRFLNEADPKPLILNPRWTPELTLNKIDTK